jgi:hypothetical protein
MFAWYWLADACAREQIPFVLAHALYLRAIHGGKNKNDCWRIQRAAAGFEWPRAGRSLLCFGASTPTSLANASLRGSPRGEAGAEVTDLEPANHFMEPP